MAKNTKTKLYGAQTVVNLGSALELNIPDPVDDRLVVSTEESIWTSASTKANNTFECAGTTPTSPVYVYHGMQVYAVDTKSTYMYVGPDRTGGPVFSEVYNRANWRKISSSANTVDIIENYGDTIENILKQIGSKSGDTTINNYHSGDTYISGCTNINSALTILNNAIYQNKVVAKDKSVNVEEIDGGNTSINVNLKTDGDDFKNDLHLDAANGLYVDVSDVKNAVGVKSGDTTINQYTSGNTYYISGDTTVISSLTTLDNNLYNLSSKTDDVADKYLSGVSIDNLQTEVPVSNHVANIKIGNKFVTTQYPNPFSAVATPITTGISVENAFTDVEKTISALSQEVITYEVATDKSIAEIVSAAGFSSGDSIQYTVDASKKYIGGSTNVKVALENLNDALSSHKMISNVENPLHFDESTETLSLKIAGNDDSIVSTASTNVHKNIINKTDSGIYAFADLHYVAATNTLNFVNTNGTREIQLTGVNFISGITYDRSTENLIFYYQKPGESTASTVNVPMSDLAHEFIHEQANDPTRTKTDDEVVAKHNVNLVEKADEEGFTHVYADIDVFDCGTYGDE